MLKRTRIFLVGSVAFLVLGLTVGLVAYYGGLSGIAFTRAAGPDELQFIPGDAAVVAYADVQAVMQSNFRQKVKALEPGDSEKGQQELRDALGIDIEHDITHVVACMLPGESTPGKNGLVVAAGNYDQAKIEGFIREKGGTAVPYKGITVWTHQQATAAASHEHVTPAFAFLKPAGRRDGRALAPCSAPLTLGAGRAEHRRQPRHDVPDREAGWRERVGGRAVGCGGQQREPARRSLRPRCPPSPGLPRAAT